MLSWLPVTLLAWLPAAAPAPAPDAPPDPPAVVLPAIPVGGGLTALWSDVDVRVTTGAAGAFGERVMSAEPLAPGSLVVVPARASAVFLGGDLRLLTVVGPARYRWTGDALATESGAAPIASAIPSYLEGPLPPLPPIATAVLDDDDVRDVGLAFISPEATMLRDTAPVLRWRWSERDARFDLTLLRVDDAGPDAVVERWRALAGRSLVLWRPLERGARYRAIIGLHGARPLARVVSDKVSFSVLDESEERALDATLAGIRAAAAEGGERPELEVLRARVFESYGLLAEAERAWAALALLYPDRPELNAQARRLSRAVRPR